MPYFTLYSLIFYLFAKPINGDRVLLINSELIRLANIKTYQVARGQRESAEAFAKIPIITPKKIHDLEQIKIQNKLKTSNKIDYELTKRKFYLQSMIEQEAIHANSNNQIKVVRKLLSNSMSQSSPEKLISKVLEQQSLQSHTRHRINFFKLAQNTSKNCLQLYKTWCNLHNFNHNDSPFSINDQIFLKQLIRKYGKNWQKIGGFFQTRSIADIEIQYSSYRKQHQLVRGRWSLRQNIRLIVLVEHIGIRKWALIAKKMPQRSDIMIRERFCNVLNPELSRNLWTKFQQEELLRLAPAYEYKWSKMVQEISIFQRKTDNVLRRKFQNLMLEQTDQYIKKKVSNKTLAESILRTKHRKSSSSEPKPLKVKQSRVMNKRKLIVKIQ